MGGQSHTAGPWRFHDGSVKGPADGSAELFDFITADGREYHAQKQPNFWHLVSLWRPHLAPTEANARLIAAAPDLMEALEGLLANAEVSRHHLQATESAMLVGSALFDTILQARAAIVKATGESAA